MPGGDRTGPLGEGPMTGGGFGFCGGFDTPGYRRLRGNRFAGRGLGLGRGGGRGGRGLRLRRRLYGGPYAAGPYYPQDLYYPEGSETELLHRDAQQLEASLDQVKKRLSELENMEKQKEKKEKE